LQRLLFIILASTFSEILGQVDPSPSLRELIAAYSKLERSDSMSGVLLRKIILKSEADKANDTLAKYGVHFFKNPSP
jgi:hypothetical protein